MNETDALELVTSAIWAVIVCSGPAVGAAMAVGIAISFLQALTQVQEATLTFVPKILAVFGAMLLMAPLIASQIYALGEIVFSRIETGF
ncbi:MAG: flagellar biosynthetic protein FliQ [Alphaproteobacteria bacterium]|nr:flagellar biosynthetic protein FliQ [Alphaproteobacteria bacterium]